MKVFLAAVAGLAATYMAVPSATAQDQVRSGTVVFSAPLQSRTKTFYFPPFAIRNSHGDTASDVTELRVTLLYEEGVPSTTSAQVDYRIQATSQNDKGGGARFTLDFLNDAGTVILAGGMQGPFMRDHCTYGGPEAHRVGPVRLSNNLYDAIHSVRLNPVYDAPYEGRC